MSAEIGPIADVDRHRRRARVRLALALAAAALMTVTAQLAAAGVGAADPGQAARGAAIYAFSCAACHGRTGQGFGEAVAAFPDDHRACTRCHHPSNAPQMPGSQVGLSTMAFSLGDPPALDGERLARFGSAEVLYHYVRAAMPRWAPASLDDQAYLDVTSHLLRLVGRAHEHETLTLEDLRLLALE